MGVDITIICERRTATGWEWFDLCPPDDMHPETRDSEVFAYFGVGRMRGEGLAVAPFANRGMPPGLELDDDGCSTAYRLYLGEMGITWAMAEELAEFFVDYMTPSHFGSWARWLARTHPGTRVLIGFDE